VKRINLAQDKEQGNETLVFIKSGDILCIAQELLASKKDLFHDLSYLRIIRILRSLSSS
jgi:hypothetical protein